MKQNCYNSKILSPISGLLFLYAIFILATVCSTSESKNSLPELKSQASPLDPVNRPLLLKRLIAAFDRQYASHLKKNESKNFSDNMAVYYLRQELQALIDMWRATGKSAYLEQANNQVIEAIADAKLNQRPLLYHNRPRGAWPCFFLKSAESQTGGHNQLCDFQGAAGFLIVADALRQAGQDGWKNIADFVEQHIVEKWLFYSPSIKPEDLQGSRSKIYLLDILNTARDIREHFAVICMDLNKLGYSKYPYQQWSKFLTNLYLGFRSDLRQSPPEVLGLIHQAPRDWGILPLKSTGGYVWYYIPDWRRKGKTAVLDTAHANRTVWLAVKAYHEGLIDKTGLDMFIKTFKKQIWKPEKSPFYFTNFVDGSDIAYNDPKHGVLPPGYKGQVWFGWHRLAAYDNTVKDLFISLAYDLTNGGPNMPLSQNKTMENAPLCFYAWVVRLLAPDGKPKEFP
jgi:hypothetical protein